MNREERLLVTAEVTPNLRKEGGDKGPLAREGMIGLPRSVFKSLRVRLEDPEEENVTWRDPYLEVRFGANFHPGRGVLPTGKTIPATQEETAEAWKSLRERAERYDIGTDDLLREVADNPAFELRPFLEITERGVVIQAGGISNADPLWLKGDEILPRGTPITSDMIERGEVEYLCVESRGFSPVYLLDGGNGIRFRGTWGTRGFSGYAVLMIGSLVVDVEAEEAFFPVVGGLVLTGEGGRPLEQDGSAWSERDHGVFWDEFLRALDELEEAVRKGDETGPTSETGTIEAGGIPSAEAFGEPSVITVPPPERRSLVMGPSRVDRRSMDLIGHLANLQGLPKKLSRVPRWEEVVQDEVDRLLEEQGDEAFRDLRVVLKDGNARGKLLERNYKTGRVGLTRDAEEALLDSLGTKWVRRVVEEGGVQREYLEGRKRAGAGTVTFGLSWHGSAYLLIEEGRDKLQDELTKEENLFQKVQEERERNRRLLRSIQDAHLVMEFVTNELGREGRNPVTIPAWKLRKLLRCEGDGREGHRRVQDCLHALRELRCRMDATGTGGGSFRYAGQFLSGVGEFRRGPGEHTDGHFILEVSETFVGCLVVFKAAPHRLKEAGLAHLLDWNKKLSKEEKAELKRGRGFVHGLNLTPFWDAAKGFTPAQSNLRRFILAELTKKRDAASKARRGEKVRSDHPEANTFRLYGRVFCPLLQDGTVFYGALGHYKKNPEAGRTLFGTRREATKTGGVHVGGLLAVLGYSLPPGAARKKREVVVRQALEDFQTVVVKAFGGVIAARLGTAWMTLEEAAHLTEKDLRRVCWLFFVPQDFESRVAADIERDAEERHAQGAAPYLVTVEKAEEGKVAGPERLPLYVRLRMVRKERGLRQEDVAALFEVSKMTISKWEEGTDPDEEGAVKGKPISRELTPLVARWVETGEPPRPEELAARRTRRQGVNPETGKPWRETPGPSS